MGRPIQVCACSPGLHHQFHNLFIRKIQWNSLQTIHCIRIFKLKKKSETLEIMATYYATHPEHEKLPNAWISPIGPDNSAHYHSYHLQRTFGERPMRTLIEERPIHTKRNFLGSGQFVNPPKVQTQVFYGKTIDRDINAKMSGSPADYNAKLSLGTGVSKIEFTERQKQLDLENTMFYNQTGYHGTIDPRTQQQLDRSFQKHGFQPWKEANVGWKDSQYISKLGGLQVSRATTFK
jgi:hypothetical protein